ncbi:MAG: hypothetical protein JJT87_12460 [Halomonas sp.]|nr:hypothetical protein [Halomonas sp.]MCC5902722.1 hypothetical protein [Halomonas sp.]
MALLDEPFYPVGPTTGSYVYMSGKPPGVAQNDFKNGLARMGGFWHRPNYFESYLLAASLLVTQGEQREDYDDIGLPAFYLQRHATELLLKNLLHWCVDIIELLAELYPSAGHQVSSRCCYVLKKSHDLRALLKALKKAAKRAGEPLPPEDLTKLVEALTQVEKSDHWSRYSHGYHESGKDFHHKTETTIPIVYLQRLLEKTANSVLVRSMGDETYESELHSTWVALNRALADRLESKK